MNPCPCSSGRAYDQCCGPIIADQRQAATAEALMRSRYSAYVMGEIGYLGRSLHPDHRHDHDEAATRRWAASSDWLGLEIVAVEGGGENEESGSVEFVATYREKGVVRQHREVSRFQRLDDVWYFVEGSVVKPETLRREDPKVGRNDPCPCGSGKKYKKCCGR